MKIRRGREGQILRALRPDPRAGRLNGARSWCAHPATTKIRLTFSVQDRVRRQTFNSSRNEEREELEVRDREEMEARETTDLAGSNGANEANGSSVAPTRNSTRRRPNGRLERAQRARVELESRSESRSVSSGGSVAPGKIRSLGDLRSLSPSPPMAQPPGIFLRSRVKGRIGSTDREGCSPGREPAVVERPRLPNEILFARSRPLPSL
jgi:hypothetical protein